MPLVQPRNRAHLIQSYLEKARIPRSVPAASFAILKSQVVQVQMPLSPCQLRASNASQSHVAPAASCGTIKCSRCCAFIFVQMLYKFCRHSPVQLCNNRCEQAGRLIRSLIEGDGSLFAINPLGSLLEWDPHGRAAPGRNVFLFNSQSQGLMKSGAFRLHTELQRHVSGS